jgi:glycosyltransferase involved in cell wall biosynthesis
VTVVVPTYRQPLFLIEALESILTGSYSDFEVLVVNDGAEDDLAPARSRLTDSRIRWITRPKRLGILANNVDAFRLARGEFIAHLDGDDRWAPGMLSTLVPIVERHPDVVVAFADHFVMDEAGVANEAESDVNSRVWGRATLAEGIHRSFGRLAVVDRSIPLMCAAVFRRSALRLGEYPEQVGCCWDIWTSHLLARGGGAAWYVPQRLAFYRWHAGNYSITQVEAALLDWIYCFEQFLKDDTLVASRADLKKQLSAAQFRLATRLLPLPPLHVEEWMRGDAGHLHRAFDLTLLPVVSRRRVTGRAVVSLKRAVRRLLFPLLEVQSSLNGANARVATAVLQQLAAQGRRIEELERRIEELGAQRGG